VSNFLVLYRSPVSARQQLANASSEQAQAGMQAWQAWAEKAGPAIVDLGAPVDGESDVTGFSSLRGDSRASVDELLADHPTGICPAPRSTSSSSWPCRAWKA